MYKLKIYDRRYVTWSNALPKGSGALALLPGVDLSYCHRQLLDCSFLTVTVTLSWLLWFAELSVRVQCIR